MISRQLPSTFPTSACTPSFPSVPTSLATRVTSASKIASWSIILLMVLTKSSTSPDDLTPTTFWVRSPRATAVYIISDDEELAAHLTHRGMSNSPDLLSQITGHDVDALGQVLPCARYSRYGGLSTELSVRSDFPGDTALVSSCSRRVSRRSSPSNLRREAPQTIHHPVDSLLHIQNLSERLDVDLLGQISFCDGRCDFCEGPDLGGEVGCLRRSDDLLRFSVRHNSPSSSRKT